MGQRTAFLVKKNYKEGTSDIRLIHHQWGIGDVQHKYFMREMLAFETSRQYNKNKLKDCFKFESYYGDNINRDTIYFEKVYSKSDKTPNIFDLKIRCKLFDLTCNNNGGMIIEITQNPDHDWEIDNIKTAFVLGSEECVNYEDRFKKLVTGEEYIKLTDPNLHPLSSDMWNNFVKFYEIEEIKN